MSAELILKIKGDKVVLQFKNHGKLDGHFGAIPLKDPEGKDNFAIVWNRLVSEYTRAVNESEEEWK